MRSKAVNWCFLDGLRAHPAIICPRGFPPFIRSSSSRRSASFSSRSALSSSWLRPSTGAVDGVVPREGNAPMILPEPAGPLTGVPSSGGRGEALMSPNGVPSRPVLSRSGSRLPEAYRLCARARSALERDALLLPVRWSDEPCIAHRPTLSSYGARVCKGRLFVQGRQRQPEAALVCNAAESVCMQGCATNGVVEAIITPWGWLLAPVVAVGAAGSIAYGNAFAGAEEGDHEEDLSGPEGDHMQQTSTLMPVRHLWNDKHKLSRVAAFSLPLSRGALASCDRCSATTR
jgi:hypothetical protein